MRTREQNTEYMRTYYKNRPLSNALNCHNLERRNRGYANIGMEEFLEYRKFCGTDAKNRTKTKGKISTIEVWEEKN
jgi:hypothetical protein